jgi:hypothetical protein
MGASHDTSVINKAVNEEVAEKAPVPTPEEVYKLLEVKATVPYVELDAFLGNPYSLLGRVIEVRKVDGKIPESFTDAPIEFSIFPIPGIKVDESSKLKTPKLRQSFVVDKGLSLNVSFLNYLSAQLSANSVFSVMVFDQVAGLVDTQDPSWVPNVKTWIADNAAILSDPEVCYVYVVIGFNQKEVVRKKFVKFEAGAKGGAYGLNVDGQLHTSTEEYSLDIRFGLLPAILKRPGTPPATLAPGKKPTIEAANTDELQRFSSLTRISIKTTK